MRKPNWLLIEKPQFNCFPKFSFGISKYCYLLPTGSTTSQSFTELAYHSEYSKANADVYKSQSHMVATYYTIFFLWFRLNMAVHQRKLSGRYLQTFNPQSKSDKTIKDFI